MDPRSLKARHSPGADAGTNFLSVPGFTLPIPKGLDLAVGQSKLYSGRNAVSISYLFDSLEPAEDAIAAAQDLAVEAMAEAESTRDGSPEVDAVRTAVAELRQAEAKIEEARSRLATLEAEYTAAAATGQYPRGLKSKIFEVTDEVGFLDKLADPSRRKLREARERLASLLPAAWRRAAASRLEDLASRRAELVERTEEFARWAAREFLEIVASEESLRSMPPAQTRAPRPAAIDADVPPPPEDLEPGAMQPPVEEAEQTKFHLQKEAESTGSADESETDTRLAPEERRQRVKELRAEGKSTRQIAEELGCDQSTVVRDLARLDADASPVPARDSEPVA